MPDISKINALAIGSVGKVDGLAKASILDIDGVTVPVIIPAPAAAYSVRLLGSGVGVSSYTGPAMRVRRDTGGGTGDDDEADIAFDSGVISLDSAISNASVGVTATTLGQFLNVGTVGGTTYSNPDSLTVTASCFVDEWKDQSGNANHATQATFGSQPQIHDGTVNTDLITENGKPILKASNNNTRLITPFGNNVSDQTIFSVNRLDGTSILWGANDSSGLYLLAAESGSTNTGISGGYTSIDLRKNASAYSLTGKNRGNLYTDFVSQHLMTIEFDVPAAGTFQQFGYWNVAGFTMYSCQEAILFPSANKPSTIQRAAIESNMNGYFSIYP